MSLNKSRWWWYRHRKASRRHRPRNLVERLLYIVWIACGALATHHVLQFWSNTNLPISVQFSGALTSTIHSRGTLLIIDNSTTIGVGDVVAFRIEERDAPIYHRIVTIHENVDTGKLGILTKGDDNRVDDRGLYTPGQKWLQRKDLYGKVVATPQNLVNLGGMSIIWLSDYFLLEIFLFGFVIGSPLLDKPLLSRSLLLTWLPFVRVDSILFFFLVFSKLLMGSTG